MEKNYKGYQTYTWGDWKLYDHWENELEKSAEYLRNYTFNRPCNINMDGKMINISKFSFTSMANYFEPKQVIFQDQKSTTVIWSDGSKTTVTLMENDEFSEEEGFAMALVKRIYGGRSSFLRMLKEKGHHRLSSKNKKLKKQKNPSDVMEVTIKFKPEKGSDNVE